MTDERMTQHLHEQLASAHARAGVLTEALDQAQKEAAAGSALRAHANGLQMQLDGAEAKREAAEQNARAAQRKQEEAERALMRIEEKNERLAAELGRARAEADQLAELNARVEKARSIHELVTT